MEGVPRLPMICSECKYAVSSVDFGPPIRHYITKHYHGEDPNNYDHAIAELNKLREIAHRASADAESVKLVTRFYAQLHLLKARIPMEKGDEAALPFTWLDKGFDIPSPIVVEDINFELSGLLHNIGALHSMIGSAEKRLSLESIKTAFTHFQKAAWAFQELKDHMNASVYSIDYDTAMLAFYVNLMLAQAQECVVEKSLIDHRKKTTVAKIAQQTAVFYDTALVQITRGGNSAICDLLGTSRTKEYRRLCETKYNYYLAMVALSMGEQAQEEQKMGERFAWYQKAVTHLQAAVKVGDKSAEVKESLGFSIEVATGKFENAKKENDFIYHEKIPADDALLEVKGVTLVKPLGFNPLDPDVSGPDLFSQLVPLSVHSSNSMYSEEKAKVLREVTDKIDKRDAELTEYLSSLKLSELRLSDTDREVQLPEILLERSAAFSTKPDAIPRVLESLDRVHYCAREVETKLQPLTSRLEAVSKSNLSVQFAKALKEIETSLSRYGEAHSKAASSNSELQKAMAFHAANLKLLAMPLSELKRRLPQPSDKAMGNSEEAVELKRIVDKVDEMCKQRQMLKDQLRQHLQDDDLTKVLLADKQNEPTEIFNKELKKHEPQISLIDQNLSAQTNILAALTEANAKYATLRKETQDANQALEKQVMSLVAAYETYTDVAEKADQGRLFYQQLFEKLRVVDEQLEKIETEINQKLAADIADAAKKKAGESVIRPPQPPSGGGIPVMPAAAAKPPRQGPRLADYLDFYRAKKAGLQPNAPPTSGCGGVPAQISPTGDIRLDHPAGFVAQQPSPPIPPPVAGNAPMFDTRSEVPYLAPQTTTSDNMAPSMQLPTGGYVPQLTPNSTSFTQPSMAQNQQHHHYLPAAGHQQMPFSQAQLQVGVPVSHQSVAPSFPSHPPMDGSTGSPCAQPPNILMAYPHNQMPAGTNQAQMVVPTSSSYYHHDPNAQLPPQQINPAPPSNMYQQPQDPAISQPAPIHGFGNHTITANVSGPPPPPQSMIANSSSVVSPAACTYPPPVNVSSVTPQVLQNVPPVVSTATSPWHAGLSLYHRSATVSTTATINGIHQPLTAIGSAATGLPPPMPFGQSQIPAPSLQSTPVPQQQFTYQVPHSVPTWSQRPVQPNGDAMNAPIVGQTLPLPLLPSKAVSTTEPSLPKPTEIPTSPVPPPITSAMADLQNIQITPTPITPLIPQPVAAKPPKQPAHLAADQTPAANVEPIPNEPIAPVAEQRNGSTVPPDPDPPRVVLPPSCDIAPVTLNNDDVQNGGDSNGVPFLSLEELSDPSKFTLAGGGGGRHNQLSGGGAPSAPMQTDPFGNIDSKWFLNNK